MKKIILLLLLLACSALFVGADGYCGDDECDLNENCEDDGCCDGREVSLEADEGNCGRCGFKCEDYEKCYRQVCITYCGNGICEEDEKRVCKEDCDWCGDDECTDSEGCSFCPSDCSCEAGYECQNNECISLHECSSGSDCDDGVECTMDTCSGMPKKCYNTIDKFCLEEKAEKNIIQKIIEWFVGLFK